MKKQMIYETSQTEGILLNANEKSTPVREEILEEILQEIRTIPLNRYPDAQEKELCEIYADIAGVSPEQVLAGNGSDQMLGYMITSFLGKGKTLYVLSPDFSMYDYYASSAEAQVQKYSTCTDGSFDIGKFIREGQNADMVMLSNPNNPTGHYLTLPELKQILEGFRVPVVVDEAYIEFAEGDSAVCLLDEYPNLYVTRTLSKAYGLAGIRIGFLISCAENMRPLKRSFVPYAVNALSMKTACVVLKYADLYKAENEEIIRERKRVFETLSRSDRYTVYPSQANFIYFTSVEKEKILQLFEEKQIRIRNYAKTDAFRITIGTKEENDLVLQTFQEFLGGEL